MEHVEYFLKSLGLGQYPPACEGNGYDDLGIILAHDDDDFDRFGPFIGMSPEHLHRLKEAVRELKNPAAPAAAATAATAATTYSATATLPTKRKAPRDELPKFCKSSQAVRLESLRHSTALGSSAMRDNKASSKRKIVYRCKSVLSKKLRKAMGPNVDGTQYKCDHCLVWNYRKGRDGFVLNQAQSVLEHTPHCVAVRR